MFEALLVFLAFDPRELRFYRIAPKGWRFTLVNLQPIFHAGCEISPFMQYFIISTPVVAFHVDALPL